jgi:hypothetical protein
MLSQHITVVSKNDERNYCTMHARLPKMIVLSSLELQSLFTVQSLNPPLSPPTPFVQDVMN